MANLFYIDTSNNLACFALFNEEEIFYQEENTTQGTHGKVLPQIIEKIKQNFSNQWNALDAVCVLNGPGSYTGLRISLATAKGICFAKKIPLILINKLDLIYYCAKEQVLSAKICAIMKAREHEYFASTFNSVGDILMPAKLIEHDELRIHLNEIHPTVCIDSIELLDDFPNAQLITLDQIQIQTLCNLLFLKKKFDDLAHSEPFYLKSAHINKINKL